MTYIITSIPKPHKPRLVVYGIWAYKLSSMTKPPFTPGSYSTLSSQHPGCI